MQEVQHYILNSTLFNHQLIILKNINITPLPKELFKNKNITVKIEDNSKVKVFKNCHIDDTNKRRLRLPLEAMIWIKNEFPFSAAYFSDINATSIWKNNDKKDFFKAIQSNEPKLDIPAETLLVSWITGKLGAEPYFYIKTGFRITEANASKVLTAEAMSSVLPYIFSSVKNTSYVETRADGKKSHIIDRTTPWLNASEYSKTAFSHPGIYLLRRKKLDGEYCYYVGKADDIKKRIMTKENVIFHPNEKYEENKQYDDICCISINMNDFVRLYGIFDESTCTPQNNPGVSGGSKVDNALYAIEDIAIHTVSMILLSEGKKLDNRQYRSYTSEALSR